jgi:hypothetical protein
MKMAPLFIAIIWLAILVMLILVMPTPGKGGQEWGSEFCSGFKHGYEVGYLAILPGTAVEPCRCPMQPPRPMTIDTDYQHGYEIGIKYGTLATGRRY